ncbi:MAG: hypothetical protein HRT68_09915 [Flavobacteriaceae bacterium]|nr:hypothetical protein [Flavobacteriaceae bacterium]
MNSAKEEIGKAIKDRLDHLEGIPSDMVWKNITERLDKEDKKRRGFFWLFSMNSIMFLLAIVSGVLLFNHFNTSDQNNRPNVIVINNDREDTMHDGETQQTIEDNTTFNQHSGENRTTTYSGENNLIVESKNITTKSYKKHSNVNNLIFEQSDTGLDFIIDKEQQLQNSNHENTTGKKFAYESRDDQNIYKTSVYQDKEALNQSTDYAMNVSSSNNYDHVGIKKKNTFNNNSNDGSYSGMITTEELIISDARKNGLSGDLLDLSSEIKQQITANVDINNNCIFYYEQEAPSLPVAKKEEKEKEKEEKKREKQNWMVTSTYTAFTYDYVSHLSPLDEFLLRDNKTEKHLNSNYGIHFGYQLTPKTSMHIGLNKVDIKLTTKDIDTIAPIISYTGINTAGVTSLSEFDDFVSNTRTFDIEQNQTYLEIPISFKTQFSNRKQFNFTVRYGFAFLWLQDQNLTAINNADGRKLDIGEFRSLPKVNYSFFLSPGVNYDLNKNIRFHVEPQMQYYINQYKNNSMNPYSLGINFGATFKFKL